MLFGLLVAPFELSVARSIGKENIVALFFMPGVCKTNSSFSPGVKGCPYQSNFLLHGLWFSSGEDCKTSVGVDSIPPSIHADVQKIFFPGLLDHEWQKHGSCSGMTPESYAVLSVNAYKKYSAIVETVLLPLMKKGVASKQQILQAIANKGFSAILACANGREDREKLYLTEVRICVDLSYNMPRSCGSLGDREHSCGEGEATQLYLS